MDWQGRWEVDESRTIPKSRNSGIPKDRFGFGFLNLVPKKIGLEFGIPYRTSPSGDGANKREWWLGCRGNNGGRSGDNSDGDGCGCGSVAMVVVGL